MGLLLFVEPEPSPPKTTLESDPTAAARSTIRRQPTVRYHSHTRDHAVSSSRQRADGRSSMIHRSSLLDIIRRDHQRDASRGGEEGGPPVNAEWALEIESANLARTAASNRRRVHDGRALLRDALSYERPGHRMRQPRESALRFEVASNNNNNRQSPFVGDPMDTGRDADPPAASPRGVEVFFPPDDHWMPSPPHTSGEQSARSSLTPSTSPPGSAALTPHFAPAYGHDGLQPERESYVRSSRTRNPRHSFHHHQHSSTRSPHHPPGTDAGRDSTDGLGDRQRSVTPELNHWETLLTTITPDERLPTPDSSFTSANASFNASTFDASTRASHPAAQQSNARRARRAMIRARIREGRYCDSDSESDSNSSIASALIQQQQQQQQPPSSTHERDDGPSSPANEPTSPTTASSHLSAHDMASDAEDYIPLTRTSARTAPNAHPHPPSPRRHSRIFEATTRDEQLGAQQQAETFAPTGDQHRLAAVRAVVDAQRAAEARRMARAAEEEERMARRARRRMEARRNEDLEAQLRTMRDIVGAMERGEEVPDAWWANAGLRRRVGEGMGMEGGVEVAAGSGRGWERL